MLCFKADVQSARTPWPRLEKYQNSTLRFSPGEDFPAHLEKMIGRPKVMRCFLTLNDAWDYRTGEYFYDFVLGQDRYMDDPSTPLYDRDETKLSPYGMKLMPHLLTHAEHADEVCFAIRRYEREVKTGKISIQKYEEITEHLIEYYKERIPNIRYIECNEANCWQFGDMKPFEFYQLYKCLYRVVNRLNEKHQYDLPLLVGGPCFAGADIRENDEFLRLYAHDTDPGKRIDFYSTHVYTTDLTHVPKFYAWWKKTVKELNLPEAPLHWNEYGATNDCSPDVKINQENAAYSLETLITMADKDDLHIYPWCSYHDPDIQVDRTQYIDFGRTTPYLPTFLGQAYIAVSRLLDERIPVVGNLGNKGVVTTDGEKYVVLVTNDTTKAKDVRFALSGLKKDVVTVKVYQVDPLHNNCFIDHSVDNLNVTASFELPVKDGQIEISDQLDAFSFTLWIIE